MAKMFYNIEEAAQRLGVGEDQVRKMVEEGRLQQFRDRDKLMFKRDQVDEMASMRDTIRLDETQAGGDTGLDVNAMATKTDKIELITDTEEKKGDSEGTSTYDLVLEEEAASDEEGKTDELATEDDLGDTDADTLPPLADETTAGGTSAITPVGADTAGTGRDRPADSGPVMLDDTGRGRTGPIEAQGRGKGEPGPAKSAGMSGSAARTGISVFDTQEIEAADSMARTQVTKAFKKRDTDEDELNLESVGSGSGLLDLTREADDTSLGAVELLDDIAPAGESAAGATGAGTIAGSIAGSSTGIFEGAAEAEAAASGRTQPVTAGEAEPDLVTSYAVAEEPEVFGGLTMLGVFAFLLAATLITVTGIQGQVIHLTQLFVDGQDPQTRLYMFVGGLIGLGFVLFIIDFVLDRKRR